MKSILVFIDWFVPGFKAGGPIRSVFNLVDQLQDEYAFYILTRNHDYCDNTPYNNVLSDQWNKIRPGVNVFYFSDENLSYKSIKKIVEDIDIDIVYINGIYSWYFSILPLFVFRKENIRKIIAPRGMLSDQAFSSKKLKKKVFLYLLKKSGILKKYIFQATSMDEENDIRLFFGKKVKVVYAPNLPRQVDKENSRLIRKNPGFLKLLNVARVSPEKNIKFILDVLKEIGSGNKVVFDQYGPVYNTEYYNKCLEVKSGMPENIEVNFKGPVDPDQLKDLIKEYHFLIFPSIGENFGHSIFESLASGVPVIVSDQTPWRNLSSEYAGWDLPLNEKTKWIDILIICQNMEDRDYLKYINGAKECAIMYIQKSDFVNNYNNLFVLERVNKK